MTGAGRYAKITRMYHLRQPWRHVGVNARKRGFTLIEIMIVVAVIALLAAVAMPAYFDSIRKARRAEAVTAVSRIQQEQERWRANNPAYTSALSDLRITTPTSGGYYALATSPLTGNQTCPDGTLTNPPCAASTCYSAAASAVAGSSQARDTGCTALSARWLGPCGAFSTTPARCWSK